MAKFIFVMGGVMSGVGKGVATSSIGALLKARSFNVTAVKIDPYLNVDAGTMNPTEHGEVFVTDDGIECDQDIGNYERFLNVDMSSVNYMTTGKVYSSVIKKERNLEYKGKTVEVVPHITDEISTRIRDAAKAHKADFVLIEIGGTVGEYQNAVYLEAARMMHLKNSNEVLFILVSYLPMPPMVGEMKTKPTQHAVRALNSVGIQPDIIIARSEQSLDEPRKGKISLFCNISKYNIISAPDIETSIYEIPLNFEKENIAKIILNNFGINERKADIQNWKKLTKKIYAGLDKKNKNQKTIKVGIIGKYFETGNFILPDAYISVIEAIKHASWHESVKPEISWLKAENYEGITMAQVKKKLLEYDGIIVPGGYGKRGIEGKINVIKYCRENNIPFFGLCYGMQLAAIEFARNICKLKNAHTTEIDPSEKHAIIHILPEQRKRLRKKEYGATMRLGAYACNLKPGSMANKFYGGMENISERHRHRYEFNNEYRETLSKNGLIFSGINKEENLVEIIELPEHKFFIATQFHPEFKSRPFRPHPLFEAFIKTASK